MRAIKTLSDVQIVLNQHDNFITKFNSTSVNRNGLKFTGNGNGTDPQDYITLSQQTTAINNIVNATTSPTVQHYTMVFTEDGVVSTGMQIPAFLAAYERTGLPIAVKVFAIGSPSGGNLTVNIYAGLTLTTGQNILTTDLIFPPGTQSVVTSSNFINPLPYIGTNYMVFPVITNGAGASAVTIEVILKRSLNAQQG
jgi:hypothetical protein